MELEQGDRVSKIKVETVRKALKMDSSNFILLGHSWGGILATEYALKYQNNLKALVISNMVPSVPEYNKYANEVQNIRNKMLRRSEPNKVGFSMNNI